MYRTLFVCAEHYLQNVLVPGLKEQSELLYALPPFRSNARCVFNELQCIIACMEQQRSQIPEFHYCWYIFVNLRNISDISDYCSVVQHACRVCVQCIYSISIAECVTAISRIVIVIVVSVVQHVCSVLKIA